MPNATIKNYKKTLGKIEHSKTTVDRNREMFYDYYFNYFYNIIVNYFTWYNLPDGIDELFIERKLLENGFVGFFNDDELGYVVQGGTMGHLLNIYDQPTEFNPVNTSDRNIFASRYKIAYSLDSFNFLEQESNKRNVPTPVIIIPNNNLNQSYLPYLTLFCEKLADIEMTIQLNRNAQVTPFFVFVDDKSVLSLSNVFNKIQSFEPVVKLNRKKDKDGQDEFKQLDDYIKVYRTDAPFLLDKLHDEKNRVMNQLLTFIGINNNNVDKKERLVQAEAISNNGVISANIEVGWKARRNAVELINKCYGLDIKVEPAEYIQRFNMQAIEKDMNFSDLTLESESGE